MDFFNMAAGTNTHTHTHTDRRPLELDHIASPLLLPKISQRIVVLHSTKPFVYNNTWLLCVKSRAGVMIVIT